MEEYSTMETNSMPVLIKVKRETSTNITRYLLAQFLQPKESV